jgi:hypothetical protein
LWTMCLFWSPTYSGLRRYALEHPQTR